MYSVLVVLDRSFGEKLLSLPAAVPVWVADTPSNRAEVERLWAAQPKDSHLTGLTLFQFAATASAEAMLIDLLPSLEEHHGPASTRTPYMRLEVIGAPLTEAVRSALRGFNFNTFDEMAQGFVATRSQALPLE